MKNRKVQILRWQEQLLAPAQLAQGSCCPVLQDSALPPAHPALNLQSHRLPWALLPRSRSAFSSPQCCRMFWWRIRNHILILMTLSGCFIHLRLDTIFITMPWREITGSVPSGATRAAEIMTRQWDHWWPDSAVYSHQWKSEQMSAQLFLAKMFNSPVSQFSLRSLLVELNQFE